MREYARIYDVRMAQFVLKIEKLSHIIGARESRDLRSPSPIMAPDITYYHVINNNTQGRISHYAWGGLKSLSGSRIVCLGGCIALKGKQSFNIQPIYHSRILGIGLELACN